MKYSTSTWLHEVRIDFNTAEKNFSVARSMTAGNCELLFKVYEKAIKAPIVERYPGGLPRKFQSHSLSTICQSYGLWPFLPSDMQSSIVEMQSFYPMYVMESGYNILVSSSSADDWTRRIAKARELVDFVENRIISDSIAFGKLIL